jgi:sugar phosphate isomerase/epimerase
MIAGTEAKNVQFQIDMGNLAQAGKDPLTYMKKYADRYFSVHIKDIADGKLGLALGEGTLDIPKILVAAKACHNLRNYVVETGARGDVVMEKLRLSQIYLRDLKI